MLQRGSKVVPVPWVLRFVMDAGRAIEATLEGLPFAFTHVVRDADRRSVQDIHYEIHAVKADPNRSPSVRKAALARAYLFLPGIVRTGLLGALHRLPERQRALAGTVGVTAVGMFGAGGGGHRLSAAHPQHRHRRHHHSARAP